MIYNVDISANFNEEQHGVNTRTAEIEVYLRETETNKLFKYFPMSAEIIQETETDKFYEVDFRRAYFGKQEGRVLSQLGVQRFKKMFGGFADEKHLSIALEYDYD
ncbi:hypothetical protein [Lactococcus protaetiae]|uniref:Uncharacterized protein n=1 Tax=Lactococcus protaetiae TaxID=2592653 RepID=A0A514Z772_9LACT|nr:hypothetical protein [Lactococcus protaetiae]QDK70403.1 hypothetical protein FLP15_03480 [Lactococcus protaetiae]